MCPVRDPCRYVVCKCLCDNRLTLQIARGTGEYDRNTTGQTPGKFGIVVGDPLVDNVVLAVPNARGYPVQVSIS
jgi:hypothetical protein